jgi:hypothetical protein
MDPKKTLEARSGLGIQRSMSVSVLPQCPTSRIGRGRERDGGREEGKKEAVD